MVEQIKSIAYAQRKAEYLGKVERDFLVEVEAILSACTEKEA